MDYHSARLRCHAQVAARLVCLWLLIAPRLSQGQRLNWPPRPAAAPPGSQLAALLADLSLAKREVRIYAEIARGNAPNSLRRLVPVTTTQAVAGVSHTATVYVTLDYLAAGTDTDYLLLPMIPILAQRLANRLGCYLPTRKLVNHC